MKTFNSVGEEIRYFTHKVEEVEDQQLEENIVRDLIESYLQESSLSKMIGDTPGGQSLVKYMHSKHLLSNDANYEEQPFNERVMWTTFKDNPDNFFILSGTHGVAGIKPNAADINRGIQRKGAMYNPSRDNTIRYQIVAFDKNKMVDSELLRSPDEPADERDPDPTVMRARGGIPKRADVRNLNNIFDRIQEQIGKLQSMYFAKSHSGTLYPRGGPVGGAGDDQISARVRDPGAVERAKKEMRAGFKTNTDFADAMTKRIMSVVPQVLGNVRRSMRRAGASDEQMERITRLINEPKVSFVTVRQYVMDFLKLGDNERKLQYGSSEEKGAALTDLVKFVKARLEKDMSFAFRA